MKETTKFSENVAPPTKHDSLASGRGALCGCSCEPYCGGDSAQSQTKTTFKETGPTRC